LCLRHDNNNNKNNKSEFGGCLSSVFSKTHLCVRFLCVLVLFSSLVSSIPLKTSRGAGGDWNGRMNWTAVDAGVEYTYIFFGLCFWSALCFVGGCLKIRRCDVRRCLYVFVVEM
jgi:hypothetical protein